MSNKIELLPKHVQYHISTGTGGSKTGIYIDIPEEVFEYLQKNNTTLTITYPLTDGPVEFTIEAGEIYSFNDFLQILSRCYRLVYKRYPTWGHGIWDLYLESAELDLSTGNWYVWVGS